MTLSTHLLTAPTHTPFHKPTIHSSLKELSSSSTQEPCRGTNIDAEWMLDGCSSIHTSGYSTGCSLYYHNTTPLTRSLSETALFRTATIVEADTPEDHARLLQPENEDSFEVHGRNSSASDSFQTSPDTTDLGVEIDGNEKLEVPVSVSHDSAAKQTATDSLTAGHTSQLPTVHLSNSTDQERSSPSFSTSVTLTGTSSEQVSSSTTVTSCTGSSLVNKIATRPPINNQENEKIQPLKNPLSRHSTTHCCSKLPLQTAPPKEWQFHHQLPPSQNNSSQNTTNSVWSFVQVKRSCRETGFTNTAVAAGPRLPLVAMDPDRS